MFLPHDPTEQDLKTTILEDENGPFFSLPTDGLDVVITFECSYLSLRFTLVTWFVFIGIPKVPSLSFLNIQSEKLLYLKFFLVLNFNIISYIKLLTIGMSLR